MLPPALVVMEGENFLADGDLDIEQLKWRLETLRKTIARKKQKLRISEIRKSVIKKENFQIKDDPTTWTFAKPTVTNFKDRQSTGKNATFPCKPFNGTSETESRNETNPSSLLNVDENPRNHENEVVRAVQTDSETMDYVDDIVRSPSPIICSSVLLETDSLREKREIVVAESGSSKISKRVTRSSTQKIKNRDDPNSKTLCLPNRLFPIFPFNKISSAILDFVLPEDFNALKLQLVNANVERSPLYLDANEKIASERIASRENGCLPRKRCKFDTVSGSGTFLTCGVMTCCLQGTSGAPVLSLRYLSIQHDGRDSNYVVVCQSILVTVWAESSSSNSWEIRHEWNIEHIKNSFQFYYLKHEQSLAVVVVSTPRRGPVAYVFAFSKGRKARHFKVNFATADKRWHKCVEYAGCVHDDGHLVLAGTTKRETAVMVNCLYQTDADDFKVNYLVPAAEPVQSLAPIRKLSHSIVGQSNRTIMVWDTIHGDLIKMLNMDFAIQSGLWSTLEKGILFMLLKIPSKSVVSLLIAVPFESNDYRVLRHYTEQNVGKLSFAFTDAYFVAQSEFALSAWNICSAQRVVRLETSYKMNAVTTATSGSPARHSLGIGFEAGCAHIYR